MTTARPVSAARRAIARATTSRGPSSASGCSSSMKRRPPASRRNAPSPRTASLTSDRGLGPSASAVGWNCTISRSARAAPARAARAGPSAVAPGGLVVNG